MKKRGALLALGLCLALGWGAWRAAKRRPKPPALPAPAVVVKPAPYKPVGIVFHHSETPASVGGLKINAARLDNINHTDHPNWATVFEGKTYYIGYHYVILPDGTVEAGRPELCVGTHARKFNNWLGICLIGAFSSKAHHKIWWPSKPTEEQKEALATLAAHLMKKYDIPIENVRRHGDVNLTNCPGDRFPFEEILLKVRDKRAALN